MSTTELVIRANAVSWAPTDDDAVIVLDLRTSRYLSLNAAGSVLWLRLVEGASRQDLVSALRDRFGIDDEVAGQGVASFLDDLRSRDLLEND